MNKEKIILSLFVTTTLVLAGCNKQQASEVPGITDKNVTVIAFDDSGVMIDFIHITPESGIGRLEFPAPGNGKEIRVAVIGPNRDKNVPDNAAITSKLAQGELDKVTVEITDGIVTSILGSGAVYPYPISDKVLQSISKKLASGEHENLSSTVIVKVDPLKSQLIKDNQGNLIPPNLSEVETKFLAEAIPAIKKKDLETLSKMIHERDTDISGRGSIRSYLKGILAVGEMKRYRFVKINESHPDNQRTLKMHHSVPAGWILTIYFTYGGDSMEGSADIVVGRFADRLVFPTAYAK